MRNLFLALPLVLAATTAHAQTCTVAEAAEYPGACGSISLELSQTNRYDDARRLTERYSDAIVLRNVGIATTVVGTIATAIGATLFVKTLCFDSCSVNESEASAGNGLLVLGQMGVAAGIPMWATGGVRAAKAERAMLTLGTGGAKITF